MLTKAKAKEMLHDGTAHGNPLTPKQKRYFGWLSHHQLGGMNLFIPSYNDSKVRDSDLFKTMQMGGSMKKPCMKCGGKMNFGGSKDQPISNDENLSPRERFLKRIRSGDFRSEEQGRLIREYLQTPEGQTIYKNATSVFGPTNTIIGHQIDDIFITNPNAPDRAKVNQDDENLIRNSSALREYLMNRGVTPKYIFQIGGLIPKYNFPEYMTLSKRDGEDSAVYRQNFKAIPSSNWRVEELIKRGEDPIKAIDEMTYTTDIFGKHFMQEHEADIAKNAYKDYIDQSVMKNLKPEYRTLAGRLGFKRKGGMTLEEIRRGLPLRQIGGPSPYNETVYDKAPSMTIDDELELMRQEAARRQPSFEAKQPNVDPNFQTQKDYSRSANELRIKYPNGYFDNNANFHRNKPIDFSSWASYMDAAKIGLSAYADMMSPKYGFEAINPLSQQFGNPSYGDTQVARVGGPVMDRSSIDSQIKNTNSYMYPTVYAEEGGIFQLGGDTPNFKGGGNWLKGAVNPAHKGWCTPLSNPHCTGHRRAFALMMKKKHGFHQEGGMYLGSGYPEHGIFQGSSYQQGGQYPYEGYHINQSIEYPYLQEFNNKYMQDGGKYEGYNINPSIEYPGLKEYLLRNYQLGGYNFLGQMRRMQDGGDYTEEQAAADYNKLMPSIISSANNQYQDAINNKTFKQAFALSRKLGDKEFNWRGKRYSTQLANSLSSNNYGETKSNISTLLPPNRRRPIITGEGYDESIAAGRTRGIPTVIDNGRERLANIEKIQYNNFQNPYYGIADRLLSMRPRSIEDLNNYLMSIPKEGLSPEEWDDRARIAARLYKANLLNNINKKYYEAYINRITNNTKGEQSRNLIPHAFSAFRNEYNNNK